ncbi:tripartite motif-containing protein 16 isoform X1 [Gadus chalcogrammus]|uniref:tripartite motif-containing protein 16 isoform X1 n=1 Tax=Gadus chalcogrammus TaxID=1042646 RepID=UPI0024C2FE62|nr:tripartite motif-containing protein 16 isoform X1 [Gadus chalcogrammus]
MPAPKKGGKKGSNEVKTPPYDPNLPEPTNRADLLKHWLPLTLDEKTAMKLLWISENGTKVARTTDAVCPYPNRPDRYDNSPQVLCKEGILGYRGYWEVDYQGWVVIGVVLESASRKSSEGSCGLGENTGSWGAGWAGSSYNIWHNGENVDVQLPLVSTIGIYVDQPAGIIKFFIVEGEGEREVRLLHKYKAKLTEKAFPGLWIGTKSHCILRKSDQ